jgi:NADH-quinone oxidoreductase subunit I
MTGKYVEKSLGSRTQGLTDKAKAHAEALTLGAKYLAKPKRMTHRYPFEKQVPHPGYRGFIILNEEKCIGCSLCARVCPAAAMKMIKLEPKKLRPVINLGRCIFCGFCVDICPTEALFYSKSHDNVFDSVEGTMYTLEDFQVNPDGEAFAGVKKVRVKIDPEEGIKYEPLD